MCRWRSSRAALLSLTLLVGCGGESTKNSISAGPPPGDVAPASAENQPLVDHPDYVNWSRFPLGTAVVRKKEVKNDSGSVRVTTTLRLARKTADKVEVESQVTVERPGQPLVENPPLQLDLPATFRLPQGMQAEQFILPALKAQRIGEEVRLAHGKEYETVLFTWEERNEAGPMTVKLWWSDDIPGRMLRQEISGRTQTSIEEVVEIIRPVTEQGHSN